ncbi:MAG: sigma-70 family RNA polymerase sigma factor [Streptosporangiaceae bacterium]|jgi:RNA polymerase sigma-70 factor (ECF subfamily)
MSAVAQAEDSAGDSAEDSAEFARLTDPFRPELLAHCYRMLGSVHDAEDQVQETLIRAWRSFGQFEGRASLRTWLYRIATNACLRAIETRRRRPLPSGVGQPGDNPAGPMAAGRPEIPWLEPFPDALLPADPADPASIAASRASIRLAFIAALQYLPPRQRAVLILRDVLDWRAAEVAELLGTTATATNSALQRARAQLQQAAPSQDELREPADPADLALLDRYATAFENADIAALTALLRDDAVFEMPPLPVWFAGRENVELFLRSHVLRQPGGFRMIPVAANGQPALAGYRRGPDGTYHANAIEVLTITASRVTRVTAFLDPALFPAFALPPTLPPR